MPGLRCIDCLDDVLAKGTVLPGASFDDPAYEARFLVRGDAVCYNHAVQTVKATAEAKAKANPVERLAETATRLSPGDVLIVRISPSVFTIEQFTDLQRSLDWVTEERGLEVKILVVPGEEFAVRPAVPDADMALLAECRVECSAHGDRWYATLSHTPTGGGGSSYGETEEDAIRQALGFLRTALASREPASTAPPVQPERRAVLKDGGVIIPAAPINVAGDLEWLRAMPGYLPGVTRFIGKVKVSGEVMYQVTEDGKVEGPRGYEAVMEDGKIVAFRPVTAS